MPPAQCSPSVSYLQPPKSSVPRFPSVVSLGQSSSEAFWHLPLRSTIRFASCSGHPAVEALIPSSRFMKALI